MNWYSPCILQIHGKHIFLLPCFVWAQNGFWYCNKSRQKRCSNKNKSNYCKSDDWENPRKIIGSLLPGITNKFITTRLFSCFQLLKAKHLLLQKTMLNCHHIHWKWSCHYNNIPCKTTVWYSISIQVPPWQWTTLTIIKCYTIKSNIQLTNQQSSSSQMLKQNKWYYITYNKYFILDITLFNFLSVLIILTSLQSTLSILSLQCLSKVILHVPSQD